MSSIDRVSIGGDLEGGIVQVLMTPFIWWLGALLMFNRDEKFTGRIRSSFLRSVFEERRQKIIQPKLGHVKKERGAKL